MAGKKINPGKYPVPQHVTDWYKKKKARPPQWHPTPELIHDICLLVASGENIGTALEQPDMPYRATFYRWLAAGKEALENPAAQNQVHPGVVDLARQWARARAARLEASIDQIEEIEAKLISIPQRIASKKVDAAGRHYSVPNPDALDPQAARIVLESRRWRLSRELPERFGDRSKVEHSGSVKVERPKDHMPDWMKEQIDQAAAQVEVEPAEKEPTTLH